MMPNERPPTIIVKNISIYGVQICLWHGMAQPKKLLNYWNQKDVTLKRKSINTLKHIIILVINSITDIQMSRFLLGSMNFYVLTTNIQRITKLSSKLTRWNNRSTKLHQQLNANNKSYKVLSNKQPPNKHHQLLNTKICIYDI